MNGELLALGVSHKTAPLPVRERLALPEGRATRVLAELTDQAAVHEAVAVSTCNRTELYLVTADAVEAESAALRVLSREAGIRPTELLGAIYSLRGKDMVEHLFSVAAGLDSMIVGEAEVQGQVKRAYELALVEGATGPVSNRLFRDALAAGKRARSETGVSRSQRVRVVGRRAARGRLPGRPGIAPGARHRRGRERRADRTRAARPRRAHRLRGQPALRPRARPGAALRRRGRDLRRPARRARGGRHRRELHRRAAPDRGARGAGARSGPARATGRSC